MSNRESPLASGIEQDRGRRNGHSVMLVVSAPSGAGKTTICKALLDTFDNLSFSVSYTTRSPRRGEEEGRDYYFIGTERFQEMVKDGTFAEYAENHGALYGTSRSAIASILEKGKDILFDIDIRGAKALKTCYKDAVSIVILPPTMDALKTRLEKRGTEDDKTRSIRIGRAQNEVDEIKRGNWFNYVVFNEKLDESIEIVKAIYVAEQCRRERMKRRILAL